MNTSTVVIMGIIFFVIVFTLIDLFTSGLNDFLEKNIKKFLWLWLPFHALKRLSKEFSKKYFK